MTGRVVKMMWSTFDYVYFKWYLPNLSLASKFSEGGDALPGPALFTAFTLNWYVLPSIRSGTRASVLFPGTWIKKTQINMILFNKVFYVVINRAQILTPSCYWEFHKKTQQFLFDLGIEPKTSSVALFIWTYLLSSIRTK